MSGARRAASFHLFFKSLPSSTTSEQTNQLDQARVCTLANETKSQIRRDEPKRGLLLLTTASFHLRAIELRLQEQWPYDWRG
jgi:hypothetical protein